MPLLRHYDHLNTARFITFCCYHRHKLLIEIKPINIFLNVLCEARRKYRFKLLGYVIMPEHVHLVLHPRRDTKLGALIAEIKSKSASRIIYEQAVDLPEDCRITRAGKDRRVYWQARCYDHNCRSKETVIEKINYCHNNPVKRGLVEESKKWRWSSYDWYLGRRDVPIEIDDFEGMQTKERLEYPA